MTYIQNEFTLHTSYDPTKCPRETGKYDQYSAEGRCGSARVVDCCKSAGPERDIVECSKCGKQREMSCSFDDECS